MSVLIIAEAGVNHNGDLDIALRLVDAAVKAGADWIKFQTFTADRIVTHSAPLAEYQRQGVSRVESQHSMLTRLELSREMHEQLIAHCGRRGIKFMSTGFDEESVDLLIALGIETFKVPSGEITNLPYLRHIGRFGKPVIMSTGMATMDEVESALAVLAEAGTPPDKVTVLHCSSEYPTPMPDVNLRAMVAMRERLAVAVGYSDHTLGIEVPVAAVALGATVIEKHLTLDRSLPGPDHAASLESAEFAEMVTSIRNIERALGDGIKRPTAAEAKNMVAVRKSLVAGVPIEAGDIFTEKNVAVKRPGNGVSPMSWDEVLGRRARRAFAVNELIEL